MTRERYRIADLTLDVGAVSLRRGREAISLPPLSFDLLVALARRAPDVASADRLVAEVWDGTAVSDETLTQRVALLRRALGDDAREPHYLRSVRGRGYQLVPPVLAAEDIQAEARTWRRWTAFAAALGAVAVIGALFRPGAAPEPAVTSVRTARTSAEDLVSRAGQYLSRHREADNELAIELYRGALEIVPEDPAALAGLSFGLAQRASKFNRSREEAHEALALADRALAVDPHSAAAHHARAMALDSRGRVAAALAEYRRAAALEPSRTAALASAANLLQVRGELATALEANLRVAAEPETPPYLEVQIGTTLAALGFEAAAAVWYQRAVDLRPDNVFAAVAYARLRLHQDRPREAAALARAALDRGIERPELALILGHVALLAGDRTEARRRYRQAEEISPGRGQGAGRLLILDLADAAPANAPELLDRCRERITALEAAIAGGDEWPDTTIEAMLLHAAFGDTEAALAALDVAIGQGYRDGDWLLLDPMLNRLRQLPAFAVRVERMRLLIADEREVVLAAPWLPPALIAGKT